MYSGLLKTLVSPNSSFIGLSATKSIGTFSGRMQSYLREV